MCDFGANLVQHYMRRYSRCSRNRTKTHDKATISHDISHYSRYQTAFLKLEEIMTIKRNTFACSFFCYVQSRALQLVKVEPLYLHFSISKSDESSKKIEIETIFYISIDKTSKIWYKILATQFNLAFEVYVW